MDGNEDAKESYSRLYNNFIIIAVNTVASGLLINMIKRAMRILKGRNDIFSESDELFQRNIIIRKTVYQPKENDIHGRIRRCT
jgi:hypothetical protein